MNKNQSNIDFEMDMLNQKINELQAENERLQRERDALTTTHGSAYLWKVAAKTAQDGHSKLRAENERLQRVVDVALKALPTTQNGTGDYSIIVWGEHRFAEWYSDLFNAAAALNREWKCDTCQDHGIIPVIVGGETTAEDCPTCSDGREEG